jgi:hypothetical protein
MLLHNPNSQRNFKWDGFKDKENKLTFIKERQLVLQTLLMPLFIPGHSTLSLFSLSGTSTLCVKKGGAY